MEARAISRYIRQSPFKVRKTLGAIKGLDVGNAINPALERGQIEGGFVQGQGWLTMEEVVWDKSGKIKTFSPSTYKIPAIKDGKALMEAMKKMKKS